MLSTVLCLLWATETYVNSTLNRVISHLAETELDLQESQLISAYIIAAYEYYLWFMARSWQDSPVPTPTRTLLSACIFISEALHILRRLSRVINRSCAKPLQRKCSMRQLYLFSTRILSARSRLCLFWPPKASLKNDWVCYSNYTR